MKPAHYDLLHDYLHGRLKPDQARELNALLRDDADAREWLRGEAALETRLRELALDHALDAPSLSESPAVSRKRWFPSAAMAAVLVTVALIAVGLWMKQRAFAEPWATIAATTRAHWTDPAVEEKLQRGEMVAGTLRLESGSAEFSLIDGATVLVEGPAAFSFTERKKIFVEAGRVVVRCPTPQSRVSVVTPETEIVDLGTEFAVEARSDRTTRVAVLSGEVQVKTLQPRTLHSGDAVEVRSREVQELPPAEQMAMLKAGFPNSTTPIGAVEELISEDFSGDELPGWQLTDSYAAQSDGTVRVESLGHRSWPRAEREVRRADLVGRTLVATARALQPREEALRGLQFAVLKLVFIDARGTQFAYASRHFQHAGAAVDEWESAQIAAVAPPGTVAVSMQLMLNARGMQTGAVCFDDARLLLGPARSDAGLPQK